MDDIQLRYEQNENIDNVCYKLQCLVKGFNTVGNYIVADILIKQIKTIKEYKKN